MLQAGGSSMAAIANLEPPTEHGLRIPRPHRSLGPIIIGVSPR